MIVDIDFVLNCSLRVEHLPRIHWRNHGLYFYSIQREYTGNAACVASMKAAANMEPSDEL